eukprot:TRINITY_DN114827_c0_g1_i1.p1 TRINITY_DN114827_c0_g1~~TRINITY_DN114827_c0_g1_i1.p1  ORF type:complete len:208 (+),score=23.70 TRINITY_DN114827_c0_g1_i1:202-825(+)
MSIAGRNFTPPPPSLQAQWGLAVSQLSYGIPSIADRVDFLDFSGVFQVSSFSATWISFGSVRLELEVSKITFATEWANPMWQLLDMPWQKERDQIMRLLRTVLANHPISNDQVVEIRSAMASNLVEWMESPMAWFGIPRGGGNLILLVAFLSWQTLKSPIAFKLNSIETGAQAENVDASSDSIHLSQSAYGIGRFCRFSINSQFQQL